MSQQKPRPERTAGAAWLRGGQTISHTFEMIWEIAKKFLIILACWGIFCVYSINRHATDDEQLYGGLAILAKAFRYFGSPLPQSISVKQPDGMEISVAVATYEQLPYVAAVLDRYGYLIRNGFVLFLLGAAAIIALATILFIRQGQQKLEDKELRGQTIATVSSLRRQIQRYNVDVVRGINRSVIEAITGVKPSPLKQRSETGFIAGLRDLLHRLHRAFETLPVPAFVLEKLPRLRPDAHLTQRAGIDASRALAVAYYAILDTPYWVSNTLSRRDRNVVSQAGALAIGNGAPAFYERYSDYKHHRIVGIELPINSLYQHTLVVGSPGSGKSQAIHGLIESIIARRECAIIYDPELEYIRAHYKEGRDIILNPFDGRSRSWSPFNDLSDYASWEQAAGDLFPLPKGSQDPYWTLASRQIYCNAGYKLSVLKQHHCGEKPTIEELIWLLIGDFDTLHYFLKNTPAERTLGDREGLRSESLRSVIVNGITRMMHLLNGDERFSISEWINSPQTHGLLFFSRPQHLEASLSPLIAHWSSIAITTLFTRTPAQSKKITHLILDEFHSLGKVEILADAPARLRKYGGSMIMGMQQVSQLDDIYGDKKAQTIIGQLATKLILRCQDPDTARFMAEQIGQREVSRTQENTSYGAHQLRDGVSLNIKEQTEFVFMPEEIMNFPMFQGVLRVSNVREGQPFPVAPVKFRYKDRSTETPGYEARHGPDPIDGFMKKDKTSSKLFSILETIKKEGQNADHRELSAGIPNDESPEKRARLADGPLAPDSPELNRTSPDIDHQQVTAAETATGDVHPHRAGPEPDGKGQGRPAKADPAIPTFDQGI